MEIDVATMNTAQIMATLYAKSFPGKKVTGFVTSSAPEVVVKAPIDWQVQKKGLKIEVHLEDQIRKFRGAKNFTTKENVVPIAKAPQLNAAISDIAYSAAKLAAYQEASGGSVEDVNKVTKKIYGADAPVVDAILPDLKESWHVRALVPSSKNHHAIFGEEKTATRVEVNADALHKTDNETAVDYGRVLLALKFVGMANSLFDRRTTVFTLFMANPQHIWPKIKKESFRIPSPATLEVSPVKSAKTIDIKFSQEIWDAEMLKIVEKAEKATVSNLSIPKELIAVAKESILERVKMKKIIYRPTNLPSEKGVLLQSADPMDFMMRSADSFSQEVFKELAREIQRFLLETNDEKNFQSIKATTKLMRGLYVDEYVPLIKRIFNYDVARKIAHRISVENVSNTTARIIKQWSNLIAQPIDVKEKNYFRQILKYFYMSPDTILDYLDKAVLAAIRERFEVTVPKFRSVVLDDWTRYLISIRENFLRIQRYWVERYLAKSQQAHSVAKQVLYQQLATSFKSVTVESLMTEDIFDDPEDHFMIRAACSYAKKRRKNYTPPTALGVKTLKELGAKIDSTFSKKPKLTWEDLGEEADTRLAKLRRDLLRILDMHGIVLKEENYAFDEGFFKIRKQVVELAPNVKEVETEPIFTGEDEELAELGVLDEDEDFGMGELGDDIDLEIDAEEEFAQCLAEWPTEDFAQWAARKAGFSNFREWFNDNPMSTDPYYEPSLKFKDHVEYMEEQKDKKVDGNENVDSSSFGAEDDDYIEFD